MSPAPADRAEGPGHHRHEPAAADAGADAAHHVPLHVDLQHSHHLHDGSGAEMSTEYRGSFHNFRSLLKLE